MTDDQCPKRPKGKNHLWKDWLIEDGRILNQRCLVCGELREVTHDD